MKIAFRCLMMGISQLTLQCKIITGYVIEVVVIGLILSVIGYERLQVMKIETMLSDTNSVREAINEAHLHITELATSGESILLWNDSDMEKYRRKRLEVDSLLKNIKELVPESYVQPCQIDSLCLLLEIKEFHLFHIIKAIQYQGKTDSLFSEALPNVMKLLNGNQTVIRKKKGLAGLLGKTEIVQMPYNVNELRQLNDNLISIQSRRDGSLEVYTDSLQLQNKVLNQKLSDFISSLDYQFHESFTNRIQEISKVQQNSFRLFTLIMLMAILSLIISFLVIRLDLRREETTKSRLQQAILENEELLEMRKKIILTVSHDIRGPLGNIHNCADLASQTREKKKREPYLEDIRHSCRHILHLVNDLMDAYRINEAGDLRNDTPFYLDRFLQRISDEFSRKAVAKALYLQSEHQNSSFVVKGDADKLEQVLANLLTNAIKFTASGTISFYSKYLEGKLHIEIRDTGIGMDEETLKRIFSPFERAAQNVNSEGFGLGLFLTKGLVKVLNGIIAVESAPGKGSIFKLEFPLPVTDELVEEDKPDNDSITILPKNVLVVDDDPILLKIAEDMLGRKGVSCTTCINFQEVVAALEQSDYDMVLTDVQMPDTDGFALLRLLRNSDIGNSKTIPIAVMTARGDSNTKNLWNIRRIAAD